MQTRTTGSRTRLRVQGQGRGEELEHQGQGQLLGFNDRAKASGLSIVKAKACVKDLSIKTKAKTKDLTLFGN